MSNRRYSVELREHYYALCDGQPLVGFDTPEEARDPTPHEPQDRAHVMAHRARSQEGQMRFDLLMSNDLIVTVDEADEADALEHIAKSHPTLKVKTVLQNDPILLDELVESGKLKA